MSKTMLLALLGLAVGACAQLDDEEGPQSLEKDEQPIASENGDGGGCVEQGDFDIEEFAEEILPILTGEIDLNDPDGEPMTGCTRGPCHGVPRPEGFFLDLGDTLENNLERFACFVDLDRPKRSQILVCPTGDDRCDVFPHPGPEMLNEPGDLNYKRILAYIRASRP
jgi:hypothetical protein